MSPLRINRIYYDIRYSSIDSRSRYSNPRIQLYELAGPTAKAGSSRTVWVGKGGAVTDSQVRSRCSREVDHY